MSKRVHLLPDDKFVEEFISNVKRYIGDGEDVFIVDGWSTNLRFITSDVIVINMNSEADISKCLSILKDAEIIYLHYLTHEKVQLLSSIEHLPVIVWIFWGADGYSLPSLNESLYTEKTNILISEDKPTFFNSLVWRIKYIIKKILGLEKHFKKNRSFSIEDFIVQIDYCATWVLGDYNLIQSKYPAFKAKYLEFAYMNPLQVGEIDNFQDNVIIPKQPYVLVGNSANPTNNHSDILYYLKRNNYNDLIVCPLSYSGTENYIKSIIVLGKNLFKHKFIPLTDYIDKSNYSLLVMNAKTLIANHLRQQAATNLMMALRFETPILALSDNTLLQTFRNWGIDIACNIEEINKIDTEKNKKIIEEKMIEENIRKMYKNLCFQ